MLFGYFVGPTTPLIWYVIVLAAFWMLWLVGFFPAFLRAWMNMSAPKYPDSAVWVIGLEPSALLSDVTTFCMFAFAVSSGTLNWV